MQYSPKLKKAMEQIKQVLKENDIAGFVMLHSPDGFTEYLNHISPSYSCISYENGDLRIRLKQSEVGKEKARQIADGTYNMVTHFSDVLGMHAEVYKNLQGILKKKWDGEEGEAGHTSNIEQNN